MAGGTPADGVLRWRWVHGWPGAREQSLQEGASKRNRLSCPFGRERDRRRQPEATTSRGHWPAFLDQ